MAEYIETKLPKKGKGFRKIVKPSKELKKYQRGVLKRLNVKLEEGIGEHGKFEYISTKCYIKAKYE